MKISETHRLARMDGNKVLSRAYIRVPQDKKKPICIFRVWTRQSHRRNGLATSLMEEAVKEFGNRDMLLRVGPEKGSGVVKADLYRFYGKFGFVRKGETQTMIRKY